jgi:hypothetical protein
MYVYDGAVDVLSIKVVFSGFFPREAAGSV